MAQSELITEPSRLEELLRRLRSVERYALDTEFHREKTYWPRLALVQVAWETPGAGALSNGHRTGRAGRGVEIALIDPLAVDVAPLAALLESPATMVAHAAEQDLEVLQQACGRGPSRLFDTQIAAGFAGHGTTSLSVLAGSYLGVRVAKGDRLADWNRRPLRPSELAYAAADVEHLLALADAVGSDLERRGRLEWALDECEAMRLRPRGPGDPSSAWWRLRDSRQLRGPARGVAQELAAWRERRARLLDIPTRQVIPDLALQAMAARPPLTQRELADVRGLEPRYLRDGVAEELLQAISRGMSLPAADIAVPPSEEVARELRPAVALAAAWVAQLARDEHIDAALLATRSDLAAYVRGAPGSRLAGGWREEMVGRPVRRLLEGGAALAFDGGGRLTLEERSGRPLVAGA